MPSDDDGKIGYKRPPVHSRFKPGQSGNPKGRSAKTRNANSLLLAELDRKITITENDVQRTLTKREALIMRLVNGALKGRPKELAIMVGFLRDYSPADPIAFTHEDDEALERALELLQPPRARRSRRQSKPHQGERPT